MNVELVMVDCIVCAIHMTIKICCNNYYPERACPNGMEYRECGPLCPYTCDSYFGKNPCFSLRCAPGGCFCPDNHVMADGHCTPAQVACQGNELLLHTIGFV